MVWWFRAAGKWLWWGKIVKGLIELGPPPLSPHRIPSLFTPITITVKPFRLLDRAEWGMGWVWVGWWGHNQLPLSHQPQSIQPPWACPFPKPIITSNNNEMVGLGLDQVGLGLSGQISNHSHNNPKMVKILSTMVKMVKFWSRMVNI